MILLYLTTCHSLFKMFSLYRFTADVRSVLSRNLHQHQLWWWPHWEMFFFFFYYYYIFFYDYSSRLCTLGFEPSFEQHQHKCDQLNSAKGTLGTCFLSIFKLEFVLNFFWSSTWGLHMNPGAHRQSPEGTVLFIQCQGFIKTDFRWVCFSQVIDDGQFSATAVNMCMTENKEQQFWSPCFYSSSCTTIMGKWMSMGFPPPTSFSIMATKIVFFFFFLFLKVLDRWALGQNSFF